MRANRERGVSGANVVGTTWTCWACSVPYLDRLMHAAAKTQTILVIEDSANLASVLRRVLSEQGYDVRVATDGDAGLSSAIELEPDLLILDVGLPRRNGLEVIQELRRHGSTAPTLMLTAHRTVSERVAGLEAGADDYLTKPFDSDELIARVRALLRRAAQHGHVPRVAVGPLVLDPITREVWLRRRLVPLTQREFALLEYFMRNAGKTLTREVIAKHVWKQTGGDETNIVDVYVAYLRKKLDDGAGEMLRTVRGTGYVLVAPEK